MISLRNLANMFLGDGFLLHTVYCKSSYHPYMEKRRMCTVLYAYQNNCVTSRLLTCCFSGASYRLRKQKQVKAEQETQRNKWKEPNRKVRNTLTYRFSGLSLELSCSATLPTVSDNQKNMLEDT